MTLDETEGCIIIIMSKWQIHHTSRRTKSAWKHREGISMDAVIDRYLVINKSSKNVAMCAAESTGRTFSFWLMRLFIKNMIADCSYSHHHYHTFVPYHYMLSDTS